MQKQLGIPDDAHWAMVKLTGPNSPGDIVAMAISSDTTGRYATESVFSDNVGRSFAAGEWQVDANHNHLVAITNVGSRPADALLTLHYDNGTKSYEMERTIQPGDQMRLSLADLIRDRVPDRNGNALPPDLSSGTYDLRDLSNGAGSLLEGSLALDQTWGFNGRPPAQTCCADYVPGFNPAYISVNIGGYVFTNILSRSSCSENYEDVSEDFDTWWSSNPPTAGVTTEHVTGVAPGLTNANASGEIWEGVGTNCSYQEEHASAPVAVPKVTCTASVTRGSSATCTVTPSGVTVTAWQFKDAGNHAVNRTQNVGSLTWSGVMVTTGTVSATVSGAGTPVTSPITVVKRNTFTFTAVSPTQLMGVNSITCYDGSTKEAVSPPNSTSIKGASCADLAFSFGDVAISDNGPNNGYRYVTSVSSSNGGQPTQFPYIVVSDLLSSTTFYSAQCGNYSSSNLSGFIAGAQLKQNVFDHEQGSVYSHWTEYRDVQNSPTNNIGTVLEAMTGIPGSSQSTFEGQLTNAGQNANSNIVTAADNEPCGNDPTKDSSQSCASCGAINYSPYQGLHRPACSLLPLGSPE